MFSSDEDDLRSLPPGRAFTVATEPLANTPPALSSASVFSRVTAFPWEPNSAFCGIGPPVPFNSGPLTPLCRPIFLFRPPFVQESDGFIPHIWGPVLRLLLLRD
eukprot:4626051-Pleurochrysis_carterae.AAC.1